MPRSYLIETQDNRYRHNRQHICSINTHIDSPFSRPYTDMTPQTHTIPIISGPSFITRPPLPPQKPNFIGREKIPQPTTPGPCPSHRQHSTPHCQCPYSRPPYTKASNVQSCPISHPPPTAKVCLNKILTHLVFLNGNPQTTTEHQDTAPSEPSSHIITSSSQSPHSSDSESEAANTSSQSADTKSTSGQSAISTASNRQLCPHLPIRCNETFLQRLQGRPQVKIMPTLPIPLPESSSDNEEEMDTT